MKRQMSGWNKRQLAKDKQEKKLELESKIPKLTNFFSQTSQRYTPIPDENQYASSEMTNNLDFITSESNSNDTETTDVSETNSVQACFTTNSTLPEKRFNISSINADEYSFQKNLEINVISEDDTFVSQCSDSEITSSATEEVNMAKDPGLWLDFSSHDVDYWIASGPSDCQNHNGPFDKSCRHFLKGKPVRYCSQKLFIGKKANGEVYKRQCLLYSQSKGSVYCFVCKLFAPKHFSSFVSKEGFCDWRNTVVIDKHERSNSHRDCMLLYLTRRQGLGIDQQLEKQIKEECDYWEHVLKRVISVIRTLTERGLALRGTEEKFGSLHNGNYLGLLELISEFDPFLASHIVKYGNRGKGNPSYLSKTICEELIEIMAKKVHAVIVDEIKFSGYFSLSVDSTPDLSHVDQLSVILRYLKDGQPTERFLTFLELRSHTGEEMANQVFQYLTEICQLNFSKCRGQSYDNAANMSGRYNGMQSKLLEINKFATYVPCAAHSLNLVGQCAVDCCLEAVTFFSTVQLLYTFFSASSNRWRILKDCIGDENVLKSLSDTRWEAHAMATKAILNSYSNILDALDCIANDDTKKGEARKEAESIANKMHELEFAFMLNFWGEILQNFHRVSQYLQSEDVNLQTCANLYESLSNQLSASRNEFDKYETFAREILPDVNYKMTQSRKRLRKKMPNDGDAPEAELSPRDKFRVKTFYFIIDILVAEMKRRGKIYNEIAEKFSFLSDISYKENPDDTLSAAENEEIFQCCQKLVDAYPEDFNTNFTGELKQFHAYVRQKFSSINNQKTKFTHAELYKIITDDSVECAFPNVDIAFCIFLTLMITNCSAERSFSQLKYIKNPLRTSMKQSRLDSLSILNIEADLVRKTSFEDIVKDLCN